MTKKKPYEDLPNKSDLRHILVLIERLENEPRFAIVSAHCFIEVLVDVLIKKTCKHGKKIASDSRTYPHSARLVILNELGIINDKLFKILDYMRILRNKCGHEAIFNISEDDINKFKEKGLSFDLHIPKDTDINKLTWLLWGIIGETWNARVDIFSQEFSNYFK